MKRPIAHTFLRPFAAFGRLLERLAGKARRRLARRYYGTWLITSKASLAGYLSLFALLCLAAVGLNQFSITQPWLHPPEATTLITGVTGLLVALFVPLALLLIQDTRQSSDTKTRIDRTFEVPVLVSAIVRFGLLPVAFGAIGLGLLVPQNLLLITPGFTVRTVGGAAILTGLVFVTRCYYKSYRWLRDGNTYYQPDRQDGQRVGAYASYRFSQLMRYLDQPDTRAFKDWLTIWEHSFDPEYEYDLHKLFFTRQNRRLRKVQTGKYAYLSVELEAYERNLAQRGDNWRLPMDYARRFFMLYARIMNRIQQTHPSAASISLLRGRSAADRLCKALLDKFFNEEHAWLLFDAMNQYARLSRTRWRTAVAQPQHDSLLRYFTHLLFDKLKSGELDAYAMAQGHYDKTGNWQITAKNISQHESVPGIVAYQFEDWLYGQLDSARPEDNLLGIDDALTALFPEADPAALGTLEWFHYHYRRAELGAVKDFVWHYALLPQPFGIEHRTFDSTGPFDDAQRKASKAFSEVQKARAIRLFVVRHPHLFEGQSRANIEKIIDAADSAHKDQASELADLLRQCLAAT